MDNEAVEKTEFTWEELDEKTKAEAVDKHRNWNVDYDWWDSTYEDAVRIGALLGITIEHKNTRLSSGKTFERPNICFSGFSSQGDGASYEGYYSYEPEAVKKITEETGGNDTELIRIAEGLTVAQVSIKLEYGAGVTSCITRSPSIYSHSGTMEFSTDFDAPLDDVDPEHDHEFDDIPELLRGFADWIYDQLEAEHEHLTSDECIAESLADSDCRFDDVGSII